jgi:hypothetical protein
VLDDIKAYAIAASTAGTLAHQSQANQQPSALAVGNGERIGDFRNSAQVSPPQSCKHVPSVPGSAGIHASGRRPRAATLLPAEARAKPTTGSMR